VNEPSSATVESLVAQVESLPSGQSNFELFVPSDLTMRGRPVPLDLAMAVIVDRLLGKGLWPAGFEQRPTGRRYRYRSTPPP
jgi:hypothetical protein